MKDKKERTYTELQSRFLDIFMKEEFRGDIRKAMKEAGYNDTTSVADIIKSLKDEMIERAEQVLAANGMKAVFGLVDSMDNPNALGTANRIKAAREILDRIGVSKKNEDSNSGINLPSQGVIILPMKGNPTVTIDDGKDE